MLNAEPSAQPTLPTAEVQALVRELTVHQAELEIQSEELRQAQLELAHSRDRYSDLYDFASVGYMTLAKDGRILEANLATATLLGSERNKVVGSNISTWLDHDGQDNCDRHRQAVMASDAKQNCAVNIQRADGTSLVVRMESIAIGTGRARKCCSALIDITETIRAEEIRAKEERLRSLFLNASACIHEIDMRGRLTFMNPAGLRMTGAHDQKEVVGVSILDLVLPEEREKIGQFLADAREGSSSHFEFKHGDEPHIFRSSFTPIKDEAGTVVKLMWVSEEVTESRRLERELKELNETLEQRVTEQTDALRKNEEQFRAFMDNSPAIKWVKDEQGRYVYLNKTFQKTFGVRIEDWRGKTDSQVWPKEFAEKFQKNNEAVLSSRKVLEAIDQVPKHGGIPCYWWCFRFSFGDASDTRFIGGIGIDITEQKQADETLRSVHGFSENLIDTAPCIVLLLDTEGRILRFNPAFALLSGWTFDEMEGRNLYEACLPERDREYFRQFLKRAIGGEHIRGFLKPILTKSGEERMIEWNEAPLKDAEGQIVGFLCTGTDVMDRLHLEREISKATEEEKERIARDLHDSLGSRLTGIAYLVSALIRGLRTGAPAEPEQAETVLEQVSEAIAEARELSRGLNPVKDNPEALPDALKNLAKRTRSASGLDCRFVGSARNVKIGDPTAANHLFRIAQEAITNAIRHSGATRVTIRLDAKDNGRVHLDVLDNGAGFDPAKSQVKGLGLHTMAFRARAIGAELTINPRKKRGTAVVCELAPETSSSG